MLAVKKFGCLADEDTDHSISSTILEAIQLLYMKTLTDLSDVAIRYASFDPTA